MEKLLWFWKVKVLFRTTLRPRAEAMLWLPLAAGNGDKNVKAIVNKNINNKVPYQACLNWTAQGWLSHHPFEILISPTKSFSPFLLLSYGCSSESRCIHNCRMTQPWKDRRSQPTLRGSESVRIDHEFHQFLQWLLKTDGTSGDIYPGTRFCIIQGGVQKLVLLLMFTLMKREKALLKLLDVIIR